MPLFLVSFFFLIFLIFLYTCLKLGRVAHLDKKKKILIWVIVGLFFSLSMAGPIAYRLTADLNSIELAKLYWISAVCMGMLATFLTLSIPFDGIVLFHRLIKKTQYFVLKLLKRPYEKKVDFARRQFIASSVTLGLVGVSGAITTLGIREAIKGPLIYPIDLPLRDIPPELHNFKIAQISDLHVGPNILKGHVEQIVSQVNSLTPHLIAVTGDLGDGKMSTLRHHLEPLKDLKSQHGTFFVTGNHEYYWNALDWIEQGQNLGMKPLVNENDYIYHQKTPILIGGVTDPIGARFIKGHKMDPFRAIKAEKATKFKILLAHRPNIYNLSEPAGWNLQLSGHTHGGQFFPWSIYLPLVYRYWKGLYKHKNLNLYVNSGTGYWGPPHRFTVPSEITLLTLKKV
jgi:predicted MPP superfamily phosphohydrolase